VSSRVTSYGPKYTIYGNLAPDLTFRYNDKDCIVVEIKYSYRDGEERMDQANKAMYGDGLTGKKYVMGKLKEYYEVFSREFENEFTNIIYVGIVVDYEKQVYCDFWPPLRRLE
jgi:5-methylcytosine-specific restriction endonuclease McrBC regulatory subunit McrC